MDEDKEKIRRSKLKIMFVQLSAIEFLEMLKNGEHHVRVVEGLPKDVKFEYAGHNSMGSLNIVCSSDEFALVGEGDIIPEFLPPSIYKLRQITDETKGRFIHLAGSYLSHEDRNIRDMAILLRNFLIEE